jgi:hypothetical protein
MRAARTVCFGRSHPPHEPEQDENNSGHHTMDVVKLEDKSCHHNAVMNLVDKHTLSLLIPVIT